MKAIALDTNVAIDVLNGQKDVLEELARYEMVYLPVTVAGELLFGAKNSHKRRENLEKFKEFINDCEVLSIHYLVAEEYSDIRIELKIKGRPIPENDIWIAATCILNELPLYTFDSHFNNIDDLDVVGI